MKTGDYQINLTPAQADRLLSISSAIRQSKPRDLADRSARFSLLVDLYLRTLVIEAVAPLPESERNKVRLSRRGVVEDLGHYGAPQTLLRFFNYLQERGMVDAETATAVAADLQFLAEYPANLKRTKGA